MIARCAKEVHIASLTCRRKNGSEGDIYLVRDSLIYGLGKIVLMFDMDRSVGKTKRITKKNLGYGGTK